MRTLIVLASLLLGIYSSSAFDKEDSSLRAKRYVNFDLLKPYFSALRGDDALESVIEIFRPIILETRKARNRLDCILNLRSFELCRL
ncbi:unnamed protein product [Cylicocyclus nassatus]|uniref:Uncharacterized protein n=1 Tax=Cylicocyclus nassatus TaxID=53992 RepID=A0AA36MAL9_CYLNA|nr:unnamed protein product [Cylicocyclus nassatus]